MSLGRFWSSSTTFRPRARRREVSLTATLITQPSELLESRTLMSAVQMTAQEQLLLELINRARMDPGAEAQRYGVGLNDGLDPNTIRDQPLQPLAPNQQLLDAAREHSDDMLARDYVHIRNLEGERPIDEAFESGYRGFTNWSQSQDWVGSTGPLDENAAVYDLHEKLFRNPQFRRNMLFSNSLNEAGVGLRYGEFTENDTTYNAAMVTELIGYRSHNIRLDGTRYFLTGVAYTDAAVGPDDDNFYSIGEGLAGGTIRARNLTTGAEFTTSVNEVGGYSLFVSNGTYEVTLLMPNQDLTYVVRNVVVNGENEKVDFELSTATVLQQPATQPTQLGMVGVVNNNWWIADTDASGQYGNHVAFKYDTSSIRKVLHGDFNGDHDDDLALWFENGDWRIALGDGEGRFAFTPLNNGRNYWANWNPSIETKEIHVGDFNGDGRDDIVGLRKDASSGVGYWRALTSGNNTFHENAMGSYGKYDGIHSVLVGDFDGVLGDDVTVIANSGVVWMGYKFTAGLGTSNYTASHRWNLNDGFAFPQVGDFNADGKDDIVAVFGTGPNRRFEVAISHGAYGGFDTSNGFAGFEVSTWGRLTVNQSFDALLVGDFDSDGRDNIAALINGTRLWHGASNGSSFNMSFWANWTTARNGLTNLTVADSNGDGVDDIIGRARNNSWYAAESNRTAFNNRQLVRWSETADWQFVTVGDFVNPILRTAPASPFTDDAHQTFGDPELLDLLQRMDLEL